MVYKLVGKRNKGDTMTRKKFTEKEDLYIIQKIMLNSQPADIAEELDRHSGDNIYQRLRYLGTNCKGIIQARDKKMTPQQYLDFLYGRDLDDSKKSVKEMKDRELLVSIYESLKIIESQNNTIIQMNMSKFPNSYQQPKLLTVNQKTG